MKFEVTGRHRETGDEQTLMTEAGDEREALERAAAYGIAATSVRRADGAAAAAGEGTPGGGGAPMSRPHHDGAEEPGRTGPGGRGGGGRYSVGAYARMALPVLAVVLTGLRAVHLFTSDQGPRPGPTIDPEELRRLTTPTTPAWAEDARRQMDRDAAALKDAPPAPASATQPWPATQPTPPGAPLPTVLSRYYTDAQGREMQEAGWKVDGRWVKGLWQKDAAGHWVRVK